MNTSHLIFGAVIIMSIYEMTEGWGDDHKWRQRRIAHVFGKRNGGDSNIDLSAFFSPLSPAQNEKLSLPDPEDLSSEDYDQKYAIEADHIPSSIINRLAYLDLINRLKSQSQRIPTLDYWDNIKSYLDYPPEQ